MRTYAVNYRARGGGDRVRWQPVNVGFWLHGVPRIVAWCRLFGHKAVVDGTGEPKVAVPSGDRYGNPHRWVVCDRCGLRGDPQGSLDPSRWNIGDRYDGPWAPLLPIDRWKRQDALVTLKGVNAYPPGRIPPSGEAMRATVGGQLVLGWPSYGPQVGFEAKVGNCGSEHVLALALHFGPFGALYLHTEDHGTWLQRRLNPTGYESRITRFAIGWGRIEWRLWSKRDSGSRHGKGREPWWRNWEVRVGLRDRLFGRLRYEHTDVPGGETARLVRLHEGEYLVGLKLRQVTRGRQRLRKRRQPYEVEWSALGAGIPTKAPLRGRVFGSGVRVSNAAVSAGTWPAEAVAAITVQIAAMRTREGWEPTGAVPVTVTA